MSSLRITPRKESRLALDEKAEQYKANISLDSSSIDEGEVLCFSKWFIDHQFYSQAADAKAGMTTPFKFL